MIAIATVGLSFGSNRAKMNTLARASRCTLPLVFLVVVGTSPMTTASNAAIITPSTISGHGFEPDRFDILDHSGQYDEMRGDAASDTFSHHEAQVTTGGIKLRLTSINTLFSSLKAGLIDYYTITGGTPGEVVSVTGHFLITGNSQSTLHPAWSPHNPYVGGVSVGVGVGLDLSATGNVTGSNPVITGGSVGTSISPFPSA
jgi:hypothetical protein